MGPNLQHSYVVHEQLLCEYAPFFQAATKDVWKGDKDPTIPLKEDSPDIVSLYVHWIYTNRILSRDSASEGSCDEIGLLVDAFVFGEKLQDGRFKDAIIDAIIKSTNPSNGSGCTWYPGLTEIKHAYEGTPSGSPLRRLIVDCWALNGRKDWDRDGLNKDFQADLMGELLAHPGFGFNSHADSHPSNGKTSTCSYHQRGDDQTCYSQRSDF